jgi:tRNA(Ile)-lysidine synthase
VHALPSGRILLAVSGGPDSLGLASLLRESEPLLAYVDHGLRGASESDREREVVHAAAGRLGLPLTWTRVSVRGSGEAAARRARYEALHVLARRHGCVALATAHTADDRAETILLNLLRGTGLRGLSAPQPRSVHDGVERLRPALDERRATLRDAARELDPVLDRSNRSTAATRPRIRTLLLPALGRLLGEDPVPALCTIGDLASRLRAELERRARTLAPGTGRDGLLREPEATFPYLVEALRGEAPPLTAAAYGSLRDFLRAGRSDRAHTTPAGDSWRIAADRKVFVERTTPPGTS